MPFFTLRLSDDEHAKLRYIAELASLSLNRTVAELVNEKYKEITPDDGGLIPSSGAIPVASPSNTLHVDPAPSAVSQ